MTNFIACALCLIFLFLAVLHFYWFFGGKWLIDASFPEIKNTRKPKVPGLVPTLIVAIVLTCIGLFYLIKVDLIKVNLPIGISNYGLWVIAILFILRAIGEFHYVGFFKKYKESKFAEYDTKYYSPLCLCIGLSTLMVAFSM